MIGKRKHNHATISDGTSRTIAYADLLSPNFEELARQFPSFRTAWHEVQQLQKQHGGSFASHITQSFSIALTQALLSLHFGIKLSRVPTNHLCPPVPNRHYYVRWIKESLWQLIQDDSSFSKPCIEPLTGALDIGVGATAIYPLLLAASDPVWRVIGTDISESSIEIALENVQANDLQRHIELKYVQLTDTQQWHQASAEIAPTDIFPKGPLRRSLECCHWSPSVSLTNPPFYDSNDEDALTARRTGDHRRRTAMTSHEGSYPGGELQFLVDLFVDSLYLWLAQQTEAHPLLETDVSDGNKSLPHWCTAMCGQKSTLVAIQHVLRHILGPGQIFTTEFAAPSHFARWFVAWTFHQPTACSPQAQLPAWSVDVSYDCPPMDQQAILQESRARVDIFLIELGFDCSKRHNSASQAEYWTLPWSTEAQWDFADQRRRLPVVLQAIMPLLDPNLRLKLAPCNAALAISFHPIAGANNHVYNTVRVQIQPFAHSEAGKLCVDRLRTQLNPELNRTNRKWRRILARDEKELQTDEARHSETDTMEE